MPSISLKLKARASIQSTQLAFQVDGLNSIAIASVLTTLLFNLYFPSSGRTAAQVPMGTGRTELGYREHHHGKPHPVQLARLRNAELSRSNLEAAFLPLHFRQNNKDAVAMWRRR